MFVNQERGGAILEHGHIESVGTDADTTAWLQKVADGVQEMEQNEKNYAQVMAANSEETVQQHLATLRGAVTMTHIGRIKKENQAFFLKVAALEAARREVNRLNSMTYGETDSGAEWTQAEQLDPVVQRSLADVEEALAQMDPNTAAVLRDAWGVQNAGEAEADQGEGEDEAEDAEENTTESSSEEDEHGSRYERDPRPDHIGWNMKR